MEIWRKEWKDKLINKWNIYIKKKINDVFTVHTSPKDEVWIVKMTLPPFLITKLLPFQKRHYRHVTNLLMTFFCQRRH